MEEEEGIAAGAITADGIMAGDVTAAVITEEGVAVLVQVK